MNVKIVNLEDGKWEEIAHGHFAYARKRLGANGRQLGASVYKLLPGKKAFPFHFHHANEEAIFVLSGQGLLRADKASLKIKAQDYIALPRGQQFAHQVINDSTAPLIYMCISTMHQPDVLEYPDSQKIGIMTGTAPGGTKNSESFKAFYPKKGDVDYYVDET